MPKRMPADLANAGAHRPRLDLPLEYALLPAWLPARFANTKSESPRCTLRPQCSLKASNRIHQNVMKWCIVYGMRTNIDIDENLVRKARKLTRLKSKRQIVDRALELLVRSESRKGILRYYGSGIWKGDAKALRRNRI
jgi:Arc/MetJ family transcription regulator